MHLSAIDFFTSAGPAFVRALGMMAIVPLGWEVVGPQLRLTLALALTIGGLSTAAAVPPTFEQWVWQLMLGLCLGAPIAVMVELLGLVGELFDVVRGQTVMQVHEPLFTGSAAVSAVLFRQVGWILFLIGGGGITLAELYQQVGSQLLAPHDWAAFGLTLVRALHAALTVALSWFAALAMVCLAVELIAAALQRVVPALSLTGELLALKSCLGLLLMFQLLQHTTPRTLNARVKVWSETMVEQVQRSQAAPDNPIGGAP